MNNSDGCRLSIILRIISIAGYFVLWCLDNSLLVVLDYALLVALSIKGYGLVLTDLV